MYTIITENDLSQWNDIPGQKYHFPNRYRNYLIPGTEVIFYKGTMVKKEFKDKRLSRFPHYFAYAVIDKIELDPESTKKDWYAFFSEYQKFDQPVLAKQNGIFFEKIPESRKTNYWRNGVRPVDPDVFFSIIENSTVSTETVQENSEFISYQEGTKSIIYSTKFERNTTLRQRVLQEKGFTCVCCGFNFEKTYGEIGKNFIHVHHIVPLHRYSGEAVKNSVNDLVPICPNCHAMIHRNKESTLSIEDLKNILLQNKNNN